MHIDQRHLHGRKGNIYLYLIPCQRSNLFVAILVYFIIQQIQILQGKQHASKSRL